MMWTATMSLGEARAATREMIELQMRYAVFLLRNRGLSLGEACDYTTISSLLPLGHQQTEAVANLMMLTLLEQLERLIEQVGDDAFPAAAWDLVAPVLEPAIDAGLERAQRDMANSFCGFTYEFCAEYFGPPVPAFLTLHFRNFFSPESPFDHRGDLCSGLHTLVEEARRARPEVTHVQCASWLNNVPRFTSLFPPEWVTRSVECPFEASAGWWGQFISRSGRIDRARAARFVETWQFPYPNRHCRCTLASLLEHLDVELGNGRHPPTSASPRWPRRAVEP